MTVVATPPFALWRTEIPNATAFSGTFLIIDAADEKAGWAFSVPKTGTIDRVCFRTGTVTTGATVDVRVETVGADGKPSGTLWGTNTNASQVILATDDNTWFEVALTAGASVSRGDLIAIVVANPSVSFGNMTITVMADTTTDWFLPNVFHFTTSWATRGEYPVGAVRYSDTTYANVPGLYPMIATVSGGGANFNSGSTPDEIGNKITLPFACKVAGGWFHRSNASLGDFTLKLYDASDVLLASKSLDGDVFAGTNYLGWVFFDNEVTLTADQVVRFTVLPTTATNTAMPRFDFQTGLMAAAPGGGKMIQTERTNAGAWTDTSLSIASCGLIVTGLDDGAGGGGGSGPGHSVSLMSVNRAAFY